MKNLPIAVLILVVAAAGIYFYIERDVVDLSLNNDSTADNLNANNLLFMQRRAQLEQLSIDNSLFSDVRFKTLRSFTAPIIERPVGRDNPFLPAERVD